MNDLVLNLNFSSINVTGAIASDTARAITEYCAELNNVFLYMPIIILCSIIIAELLKRQENIRIRKISTTITVFYEMLTIFFLCISIYHSF